MEQRLRKYIDDIFAQAAPTKRAVELKEEMLQNLTDKYEDLLRDGKSAEVAYNIAVAGIGDVSDLLSELSGGGAYMPDENARRRSAMLTSIAVMLYILSFLPFLVLSSFGYYYTSEAGTISMLVIVACATGLLVYNNLTKPRFRSMPDTLVDEFRAWQSESHRSKSLRASISLSLWSLLIALYFVISFSTQAWHITWIMFLLGFSAEALINVFRALRK